MKFWFLYKYNIFVKEAILLKNIIKVLSILIQAIVFEYMYIFSNICAYLYKPFNYSSLVSVKIEGDICVINLNIYELRQSYL